MFFFFFFSPCFDYFKRPPTLQTAFKLDLLTVPGSITVQETVPQTVRFPLWELCGWSKGTLRDGASYKKKKIQAANKPLWKDNKENVRCWILFVHQSFHEQLPLFLFTGQLLLEWLLFFFFLPFMQFLFLQVERHFKFFNSKSLPVYNVWLQRSDK